MPFLLKLVHRRWTLCFSLLSVAVRPVINSTRLLNSARSISFTIDKELARVHKIYMSNRKRPASTSANTEQAIDQIAYDAWLARLDSPNHLKAQKPAQPSQPYYRTTGSVAAGVAGRREGRRSQDYYETPYSMTRQLLGLGLFDASASTLEPAVGGGAIKRILVEHDFTNITGYDVETDFLKETRQFSQIITNPPFNLSYEFIAKAKKVASDRFAMLFPLSYLHGKRRYDSVFRDKLFPLASVNVFVRASYLGDPVRKDGRYSSGMVVYAWYFWDRAHQGEPVLRWMDNSKYILPMGTPGQTF